ncbi:MAG: hypothetical protein ACOCXA_08580 [Planctomycetota bacterium]
MIAVIDAQGELARRLQRLLPAQDIVHMEPGQGFPDGPVLLVVYRQERWDPNWVPASRVFPATRHVPVLLISRRAPADPLATWFDGIDDWLPVDAEDARLLAHLQRLLPPPQEERPSSAAEA